jgi:hypothetical protein
MKLKKDLITYYKTYGIIVLKKNINANYSIIVISFEKEVNSPMKRNVGKEN